MNVEYNGVVLQYASITSWDESAEYDSSGMNLIANKISLTIEGSVFPLVNSHNEIIGKESTNVALRGYEENTFAIPDGTKTFAFRLNTCLRNLSLPRGDFSMRNAITNEVYFEAYSFELNSDGTTRLNNQQTTLTETQRRNVDVNGGPKPRNIRVLQTCNEFARISFSIEITKIRCLAGEITQSGEGLGEDPTSGDLIVSNRFWTEETMDANFYVTRVFTGKLRISTITKSVHFYRHLFYPRLEDGFRRESVRFAESEDGLELSYSVTDKQVRCSAPYPATAFSGTCSYSISNSAEQDFNINLTMVGRPDASKPALVARCMQAVYAKLKEVKKVGNGIMRKLNISENLGDPPSVTISASYMLVSSQASSSNPATNTLSFLETTMVPAAELIGQPMEWAPLEINGYSYVYRRLKSQVPNPYGYDVFSAYGEDEEENAGQGQQGQQSGQSQQGEDDEPVETNPSYGYIKCLASAPCAIKPPKYAQANAAAAIEAELQQALTTKIVKDETGTQYSVSPTDVNADAIEYPYSFYKSDITYFTDYSRVVLPKAPGVGVTGGSTSVTELRQSIQQKNREIERLEEIIQNWDDNSGSGGNSGGTGSGSGSGSGNTGSGNNNTGNNNTGNNNEQQDDDEVLSVIPQTLSQAVSALRTAYQELADLRKQLDSYEGVRVVEIARPVPKARIVIEAERFGRLPEMPNPDEIISTTGSDPIIFTCLKSETQICDPRAARNTQDSVSYNIIGTYEYAMSRQYKLGDEIWLLQNPTFGSTCYYPKKIANNGTKVDDLDALTFLYKGKQLNHVPEASSSSNSGGSNNQQ